VSEGFHSVGWIVGEFVEFAEEEVDVELVGSFEDEGLEGGESGLGERKEEKWEGRKVQKRSEKEREER